MTVFVVDTNVTVVANGRNIHADEQCQLACIERLESLTENKVIAIDERGEILKEYARHLSFSGHPGVGDKFFKYIVDYQHRYDRIRMVEVTPSDDDQRGFEELPANCFDHSDRKFLAVAVVANAVVLNATDSDWSQQSSLMDSLDVKVDQICPQHASRDAGRPQ